MDFNLPSGVNAPPPTSSSQSAGSDLIDKNKLEDLLSDDHTQKTDDFEHVEHPSNLIDTPPSTSMSNLHPSGVGVGKSDNDLIFFSPAVQTSKIEEKKLINDFMDMERGNPNPPPQIPPPATTTTTSSSLTSTVSSGEKIPEKFVELDSGDEDYNDHEDVLHSNYYKGDAKNIHDDDEDDVVSSTNLLPELLTNDEKEIENDYLNPYSSTVSAPAPSNPQPFTGAPAPSDNQLKALNLDQEKFISTEDLIRTVDESVSLPPINLSGPTKQNPITTDLDSNDDFHDDPSKDDDDDFLPSASGGGGGSGGNTKIQTEATVHHYFNKDADELVKKPQQPPPPSAPIATTQPARAPQQPTAPVVAPVVTPTDVPVVKPTTSNKKEMISAEEIFCRIGLGEWRFFWFFFSIKI